jgi:hypothetical protein
MFFNVLLNSGSYGFFTSSRDSAFTSSATYDSSTFVFAGLVSDAPFSSISFNSTGPNGSFSVPEVVLVMVPEPATLGLLAGGLLFGGAAHGWRRCSNRASHRRHPRT